MNIKIITIIDDEELMLDAISLFLTLEYPSYKIKCFKLIDKFLKYLNKEQPEVIILDVYLKSENSLNFFHEIKRKSNKSSIIYYTSSTEKKLYNKALQLGADGFLYKSFNNKLDLKECINRILNNKKYFHNITMKENKITNNLLLHLTSSEMLIYKELKQGKTTQLIAKECFISVETVKNHRKNIYKKLNIHTISELILF